MSVTANRVRKGFYADSVALMRISRGVASLPGVEEASLMIGTPSNRDLLAGSGLLAAEGEKAQADDLVIAVRARDAASAGAKGLLVLSAGFAEEGPEGYTLHGSKRWIRQIPLSLARRRADGSGAHSAPRAGALHRLPLLTGGLCDGLHVLRDGSARAHAEPGDLGDGRRAAASAR